MFVCTLLPRDVISRFHTWDTTSSVRLVRTTNLCPSMMHDDCTMETTLTFWRKPDRNRMRFIQSNYKKNRMYAVNNLFVHMKVGSEREWEGCRAGCYM